MPWSNQGGGGPGDRAAAAARARGAPGRNRPGRRRPTSRSCCAAARTSCGACCRAAIIGGRGFALLALGAVVLWGVSGFFRVEPDELGVVLRFGKDVREVQPGLNYHLPYPIETVLTPKALRVNKIDVGMRIVDDLRRGTTVRDVPEESLMLTGDENIVDVDFSVLWRIKPNGVGEYLFNIQNPEGTVKAVAESAMREVIGRSDIQPILTGARQTIETAVQELMQKTLDNYGAGILVAAGADAEGRSAGAGHRRVPRRAGGARRPRARAERGADLRQPRGAGGARPGGADPAGAPKPTSRRPSPRRPVRPRASSRSTSEYKKAPDVTRQRMYLETMERVLGGTDKIILDSSGAVRLRRRALSAAQRTAAAGRSLRNRRRGGTR